MFVKSAVKLSYLWDMRVKVDDGCVDKKQTWESEERVFGNEGYQEEMK